jgi:membrane protein insertase Oxa1/YidC/SpoIIIJ
MRFSRNDVFAVTWFLHQRVIVNSNLGQVSLIGVLYVSIATYNAPTNDIHLFHGLFKLFIRPTTRQRFYTHWTIIIGHTYYLFQRIYYNYSHHITDINFIIIEVSVH